MTRVTGGLTKLIEILLETNLPAIQSVLLKAIASITSKHRPLPLPPPLPPPHLLFLYIYFLF